MTQAGGELVGRDPNRDLTVRQAVAGRGGWRFATPVRHKVRNGTKERIRLSSHYRLLFPSHAAGRESGFGAALPVMVKTER